MGTVHEGVVRKIHQYGAFIDFDGVTGLLHISDITHNKIDAVDVIFMVGDKVWHPRHCSPNGRCHTHWVGLHGVCFATFAVAVDTKRDCPECVPPIKMHNSDNVHCTTDPTLSRLNIVPHAQRGNEMWLAQRSFSQREWGWASYHFFPPASLVPQPLQQEIEATQITVQGTSVFWNV